MDYYPTEEFNPYLLANIPMDPFERDKAQHEWNMKDQKVKTVFENLVVGNPQVIDEDFLRSLPKQKTGWDKIPESEFNITKAFDNLFHTDINKATGATKTKKAKASTKNKHGDALPHSNEQLSTHAKASDDETLKKFVTKHGKNEQMKRAVNLANSELKNRASSKKSVNGGKVTKQGSHDQIQEHLKSIKKDPSISQRDKDKLAEIVYKHIGKLMLSKK
jgi:hypothetical protein